MPLETVAVARHAMATRFEIVLEGDDPMRLRAAGELALDEIETVEAQLSLYRASSEVANINAYAADGAVRVESGLFRLLKHARELHRVSMGAFDITIAPLVRCWGFMKGAGAIPEPAAIDAARACSGMDKVVLNDTKRTIRFTTPGAMLDFGAIGKGHALDRAAEVLREAGVENAFLHGGTSTVYALGHPSGSESWKVAVKFPVPDPSQTPGEVPDDMIAIVPLKDEGFSVSAVWGKSFQSGGRHYGHVLDPRSGEPVNHALLSAVVLPSATDTDALSTALLVLGEGGHDLLAREAPGIRSLVVLRGAEGRIEVEANDFPLEPAWNAMLRGKNSVEKENASG
jgi:FAD:protein FMN transferase